jgi:hypothetical protein
MAYPVPPTKSERLVARHAGLTHPERQNQKDKG